MPWSANITAFKPDPHILFIVRHSTLFGKPERSAACLAGAWPIPADKTFPKITSSTVSLSKPIFLTIPLITKEPSSGAEKCES
jgi:hypothetical protein